MIQLSTPVRNARLDAIEVAIGASPKLLVFTGAPPASSGVAATGTLLASIDLPADWLEGAVNGAKAMKGPWPEVAALAAGRAGYYRILAADGACHVQGLATGPWTAATAFAVGDHATADGGKVYRATVAGVSASSGNGPVGTGGGIADGGVTWTYAQSAADLALVNGTLTKDQPFSVTAFSLNDPNA